MRKRVPLLLVAISLTACTAPSLPDPSSTTPTSGSAPIVTMTSTSVPPGPIRGALPDGTIYDIAFPVPKDEEIVDIEAPISIEVDGADVALDVSVRPSSDGDPEADLVFEAGNWMVEVAVPDSIGDESRDLIESSLAVTTEVEMPVITLQSPLHWTGSPHVAYETFLVQSGCPADAAACNPTHAVSVLPRQGVSLDAPISVQSYSLRPEFDQSYLPPGPLTARWYPDVLWTGQEMIVWGGATNPGPPHLVDGAALDPASNEWLQIAYSSLKSDQATRAVWTGTEMVIIGEEDTVGWDPRSGEWRQIADGLPPPLDPGMSVAMESEIVSWTAEGLYVMEAGHDWNAMPDPGVGLPDLLGGSVLRVADSQLFAIGQDGCDRLVTSWNEERWTEPARIFLEATPPACGQPNQSAAVDGRFIFWDDTSGVVVSFDPSSGSVDELPTFPLRATEHASGPVLLDDGFLVPAGLEAAIFDPSTDRWAGVELPGPGTDVDMVWTGVEILMWGKCCHGPDDIDAWRWVPPTR
jgi:hypothetical protein